MGRNSPKTKKAETAWEHTGLTGAERDAATSLVQQLAVDGKLKSLARAGKTQGVTKKNLMKVLGGLAMKDRRWEKFLNQEVIWKCLKFTAMYKFVS